MKSDTKKGVLQPSELRRWMQQDKPFILIDVLPKEIYEKRRPPGALNACVYEVTFPDQIAAITSTRQPTVVVGVGGFSSGPVLALAALRRLPTLLLEQNALPGLTNRLLAPIVRAAAVNFEEAVRFFPRTGFVAGNPVRAEFFAPAVREGHDQKVRVLIFGGSQGAHAINLALVAAAPQLAAAGLGLAITHQTGERDLPLVRDAYQRAGLDARAEAFLYEMDREMTQADLVVARAGATTLCRARRDGATGGAGTAADIQRPQSDEASLDIDPVPSEADNFSESLP